jgi:hypothetical protein
MLIKLINDFPSLVVMLVGTVIGLFCLIRGDFRGTLQFSWPYLRVGRFLVSGLCLLKI